MSTKTAKTVRPGNSMAADEWLAKKLLEAGFGGADCDFLDCIYPRARRTEGKSGSPTKFCVQHNNPRDRQRTYRRRKALEKERAARPAPVPVQTAVARAVREEQVLASLLPRVLTALQSVQQGQQAGADTAAVAAHIEDVTAAAEQQVHVAEQARETAVEQASLSDAAAEAARAEEASAVLEAACALKEAGAADTRAVEAVAAHGALDTEHRALRTANEVLQSSHRQLAEQHEALTSENSALATEHQNLRSAHGRLQGEAEALRGRVSEQSKALEQLQRRHEENLSALATAQTENTGLTSRLQELLRHQDELGARNTALAAQLDQVHASYRQELAELREELAAALQADVSEDDARDRAADDAATEGRDTEAVGAEQTDGSRRRPSSLVDLGRHAGSSWALVRYDDETDSRWYLLRDGEQAGVVQPEYPGYGTSKAGWSARTANAMPVKSADGKHFSGRDKAAGALIRNCVRGAPSSAEQVAARTFVALDDDARTALVAAVIPLATAAHQRWAKLPAAVREAALNTALRNPTDQDLEQLVGLSTQTLGRSKEAQRLLAALQCLQPDGEQEAVEAEGPVVLGTLHGRAWRLEPDPHYLGGFRVLGDGVDIGAVTPVRKRKSDTVRWTAEHRRRSLGRGPSHPDRDAAVRAVTDAEASWAPLPELNDESFRQIPAWQRINLYGAAGRIDLRRGRLAQLQPGTYRRELHQAIGQARRSTTGSIRSQHLTVLLDVAREDLGSPSSASAQRLYDAIQEIRKDLVAPQAAS